MEVLQPIFECPVCLDRLKDPKVLGCFHSLCSLCVQNYAASNAFVSQVPCPTCRQMTTIPAPGGAAGVANLPVNSYLVALMDMAAKVLESAVVDKPSSPRPLDASGRSGGDGKAGSEAPQCGRHSSEDVQLYCTTCACPICIQCVLTLCKQHEHKSIASAAGGARSSLTQLASRAGTFMGTAARAGTDTKAYCADMREQKVACLSVLEQRKADAQAALQSAYDSAVRHVEKRSVAWEAKAKQFMEKVDRSQSECQRQLIGVGELISHRSDIAVVASFAAAERRLSDLLAEPWLREASLSKEKFVLSSNNEFVAPLKKYFLVSSAEERGTELRLFRSVEVSTAPAAVAGLGPIKPADVGKTHGQKQAPIAAITGAQAYMALQQQPLTYPGYTASSSAPPAPPASVQFPPPTIMYPGITGPYVPTNSTTGYSTSSGNKLGTSSGQPLAPPPLMSYPTMPLFYPSSGLVQPPAPGATGSMMQAPLPAAAAHFPATVGVQVAGPTKTAGAGTVYPNAVTTSFRNLSSPAPAPSPVPQVSQKLSKKVVKRAVKGHLSGLKETGNTADVVGPAILTYLRDAQCDSNVLAAVIGVFFDEACARPEVSRGLARVSALLDKLPAVANCAQLGNTITYKKMLQDRIKCELDLKAAAAVVPTGAAAAATGAASSAAASKLLMHKVQFIVHLFEEGVVSEWTLHDCIIRCLKEESVEECLEYGCGLLSHYCRRLDTQSGVPRMNQHFNQIKRIITLPNVSPRLVTMFQDLLQSRDTPKKTQRANRRAPTQKTQTAQDQCSSQ